MKADPGPLPLTVHLALLAAISFGGFPTVLPDVRTYVVLDHGWLTDRDFVNLYAVAQMLPGPNMVLMMGLLGWTLWGLPGALAAATATFGPPSVFYFVAWRLWDRFRDARWQRIVRTGLAPVTVGLVIASGVVVTRTSATDWLLVAITACTAAVMLTTRLNPLWFLAIGGLAGALRSL